MSGMISIWFWPGLYTRANTESYKDLGDKNQRVQVGQYFTALTGAIFYDINGEPVDETLNIMILLFGA